MEQVGQHLCSSWQLAHERVDQIPGRLVCARSAVKRVDSSGRMHSARHRHVSQGMLDRKRLDWHGRVFRQGDRPVTAHMRCSG
jgi:hypothetical protein